MTQVPPHIKVYPDALELLAEAEREEIIREANRAAMASDIARHRWTIAQHVHRLQDGRSKLDFKTRPFLKDIYQDASMDIVVYGASQFGKAQRRRSKILTPYGWRRIGDLKIGDKVITVNGTESAVVGIFPQGVKQIYRITFADGRSADACGEHLWEVSVDLYDGPMTITTLEAKKLIEVLGAKVSVPVPNVADAKGIDPVIESIELTGVDDAVCILIDDPRHLYITDDYIVTHNSEWLICDAVASAGLCGMKLLWVISKQDKMRRFVADRIDPAFNSVPVYRKLFEASKQRGSTADSTQLKHIGNGSMLFIYATAEREFTSWAADKYVIDEHQECEQEHLAMLPDRLSGSDWGFKICVGHPSIPGSPQVQNLDFLYQNSDQRKWVIPCPTCAVEQELDWWTHCVIEKRNDHGAILSVEPRDQDYRPGPNSLDMRPICANCDHPMNRLSQMGFWKQTNPEAVRHGYRISNLYNARVRLSDQFNRYVNARGKPTDLANFYNKVLGICFSMSGTRIEDDMLANCARGDSTGIVPYRFVPVSQMQWRDILKKSAA